MQVSHYRELRNVRPLAGCDKKKRAKTCAFAPEVRSETDSNR